MGRRMHAAIPSFVLVGQRLSSVSLAESHENAYSFAFGNVTPFASSIRLNSSAGPLRRQHAEPLAVHPAADRQALEADHQLDGLALVGRLDPVARVEARRRPMPSLSAMPFRSAARIAFLSSPVSVVRPRTSSR